MHKLFKSLDFVARILAPIILGMLLFPLRLALTLAFSTLVFPLKVLQFASETANNIAERRRNQLSWGISFVTLGLPLGIIQASFNFLSNFVASFNEPLGALLGGIKLTLLSHKEPNDWQEIHASFIQPFLFAISKTFRDTQRAFYSTKEAFNGPRRLRYLKAKKPRVDNVRSNPAFLNANYKPTINEVFSEEKSNASVSDVHEADFQLNPAHEAYSSTSFSP